MSKIALISCGAELYRRYLLESLCGTHEVILFTNEPAEWTKGLVREVVEVEPSNITALTEAVGARHPDGVLCWDERFIVAAATVADNLSLPSPTAQGANACKDKALTRNSLTAAGILQPAHHLLEAPEDANHLLNSLTYPVVVKPQAMGASIGVQLVEHPGDLRPACDRAAADSQAGMVQYRGRVLVEEFVEGPEISVEGVCVNGRYQMLFVARKRTGMHPYFEELGHVVNGLDPLLHDPDLRGLLEEAHAAIGYGNGVTHAELLLSDRGPVIVEINGRLGGDLIPYLGELVGLLDPALVAANACLGLEPQGHVREASGAAAIAFRYPDSAGVVSAIPVAPAADLGAVWTGLVGQGDRVSLPPAAFAQRVGFAVAQGVEVDVVEDNARRCAAAAEILTKVGV